MGRLANLKRLSLPVIFLGLVGASTLWGQTLGGFPKIIFTDPYQYQKLLERCGKVIPGEVNFENYWGQIDSCGINLDVTFGDEVSLNNSFGVKIFNQNLSQVIDDNFPWTDPYLCPVRDSTATVWHFADGQEATYDVGEYGGRFDCPPATGDQYQDPPGSEHWVYRALVSQDTAGPLLDGTFDRYDQGRYRPYYVTFRMKMVGDTTQHIEVARVKISFPTASTSGEESPHFQLLHPEPDTGVTQTGTINIPIYADDFHSPGSYEDLTFWKVFSTSRFDSTRLVVEWHDSCDLYIDNVFIGDVYYYYSFEYNGGGYYDQAIKDSLVPTHNINPAFNYHWYKDEPWPTMLISYKYVDSLSMEAGTVPLNGAFCLADYFDYFLQTLEPNELIFDKYYIKAETDSASEGANSLQNSWGKWVWWVRRAIQAANGDPANPNDDIPFWMTIQVSSLYDDQQPILRDPTAKEIEAQVYLSLCYGAKGIMYFSYPSVDYREYWGEDAECVHGMVDLVDAEGDPTDDPTLGHYVRNYKWYVVRDMNAVLDSLNPVIQELTWIDAGSWDEVSTLPGSYIDSIRSDSFPQDSVYVEVGFFEDDGLYDYFMLVNRRCLSSETQTVTATLDLTQQGDCYTIKDMYSGEETVLFNRSGTVDFTTTLGPGQGKLFRLRQGAYLTSHYICSGVDTIHCDLTVAPSGTLTVAPSGTLTIQPGVTLKFASDKELTVEGTLIAKGMVDSTITFTSASQSPQAGDWYGIRVMDGGKVDINRAKIEYGYCGLRLHSGSIDTVKNCHITQNEVYGIRCETHDAYIYKNTIDYNERYGIYVYNHSPDIVDNVVANYPQSTPSYDIYCYFQTQTSSKIKDNELRGNPHGVGLYLYRSRPLVEECTINNDSIGIVAFDSEPVITGNTLSANQIGLSCDCLADPTFKKSDILNSTMYGVYCTGGSYPVIGGSGNDCCKIAGSDSFHVYNDNQPKPNSIMAEWNCWGAVPPDTTKFAGPVDYNPYLVRCLRTAKQALTENLPQEFSLSQNYPNPFNPTTVIRYALPENQYVSLKVYNLLGQVVTTLVDEQKAAGYYQVRWNGKNSSGRDVASGVYFYCIKAGSFVETKKLVLLR